MGCAFDLRVHQLLSRGLATSATPPSHGSVRGWRYGHDRVVIAPLCPTERGPGYLATLKMPEPPVCVAMFVWSQLPELL
jgi:hypothetical protein